MTSDIGSYAAFLGSLTPERLAELPRYVAQDVEFRDPFNQVIGADTMAQIFRHMYETIGSVTFDIRHHMQSGDNGCLHWQFHGTLRGKPWTFPGMSFVTFTEDGLVSSHVDHWDAAREFYEHFPVVGWSLKAIRSRIAL